MDEFWSNLEAIAAVEAGSVLEMGRVLDLFLDVVGEHWDFLHDTEPLRAAQLLLGSRALAQRGLSRRLLLGLLPAARQKPPQWAAFLATVLGTEDTVLDLMTAEHLRSLVETAWMYRYTEERCLCLYLQLLFVVLMRGGQACEAAGVHLFSPEFARMLLEKVCESEGGLGLAALKLLGAINHLSTRPAAPALVEALRAPQFYRIGERLIWHFNRHRSPTSQLLTLKLLYLVVSREDLRDALYLNDLRVLLDIFVRELSNASHQDDRLKELYLVVLLRVLSVPALAEEPYKQGALVRVLRLELENTASPALAALANECLAVPWLGWHRALPYGPPRASRDNLVLATRVESVTDLAVSPFEDGLGVDSRAIAPPPPRPRTINPFESPLPLPPSRVKPPPPPPRRRR